MIVFRTLQPADIAAGLSLCRSAKWNQLARDWEIFLKLNSTGCLVATLNQRVVGTVTTLRYSGSFSWIGMLLVDPAYQRQGIGIELLKQALRLLENEETVKLDATPAGREVYLKLDFTDEYRLSRLQGTLFPKGPDTGGAAPLQKNEWPALADYDRKIFGADRQPLLEWIRDGAPAYAYRVMQGNEINGYCLGRNGQNFEQIGPVIADSLVVAKNLVAAALKNCEGKPVIIDALHFDKEWMDWLSGLGFTEQRLFTRMYRGTNKFPGIPEKQFSILGPEFG